MKVDYKTHPILEKLENGRLGDIRISEKDKAFFDIHGRNVFVRNWNIFKDGFKKEINVLSLPFIEACEKSQNKLMGLVDDILENDTADFIVQGTYVFQKWVCMIDYRTLQGSDSQEMGFFIFTPDCKPLAMNVMSIEYDIFETTWISNMFKEAIQSEDEILSWVRGKMAEICTYAMFKKYAQVETKILKPKQKVMGSIVCKYKNDTNLNLTFLDSKWFTNLVKSDAFNVRGHFRLQPKKVGGEWTKELIWIADFQKTGYTAPARILSQTI